MIDLTTLTRRDTDALEHLAAWLATTGNPTGATTGPVTALRRIATGELIAVTIHAATADRLIGLGLVRGDRLRR